MTAPRSDPREPDQRVILHGISWETYEAILADRGESASPRLTYLDGELELMSPSIDHEAIKKCLARLLEAWADERGWRLEGYGSWTLKDRGRKLGAEADECYVLDGPARPAAPDIAIEVQWTRGGIDKLAVYAGLRVREVWTWDDGVIDVHALRGEQHEKLARSEILPEVDLALLARLAVQRQWEAVRELRALLRA